jgi:hypothetical protein
MNMTKEHYWKGGNMKNELWDKEEFEDCITKAIIGLYETKDSCLGKIKNRTDIMKDPRSIITPSDFLFTRKLGAYFAPSDRVSDPSCVDLHMDGLPSMASWTECYEDTGDDLNAYVRMRFLRRINKLPRGMFSLTSGRPIAYYEFMFQAPRNDKDGAYLTKFYATIDSKGKVYVGKSKNGYIFGREEEETITGNVAVTIQLWEDRKYLWNVKTIDADSATVTVGVYPEQIKSLFYSRNLPISDSGRRRPILHWVQSHRRRMKEGIDVDIEKHLRGTESFEMGGSVFTITNPIKGKKVE